MILNCSKSFGQRGHPFRAGASTSEVPQCNALVVMDPPLESDAELSKMLQTLRAIVLEAGPEASCCPHVLLWVPLRPEHADQVADFRQAVDVLVGTVNNASRSMGQAGCEQDSDEDDTLGSTQCISVWMESWRADRLDLNFKVGLLACLVDIAA